MSMIVERAKQLFTWIKCIFIKPTDAVESLKSEEITIEKLIREYYLYIGLIPLIFTFLGLWGSYRYSFGDALGIALLFVLYLTVGISLTGLVIRLLARYFESDAPFIKGVKISFLAWTPYLISRVLNILLRVSQLSFFALCYGFYILYIANTQILEMRKEKNWLFTVIIAILMLIFWFVGYAIYN